MLLLLELCVCNYNKMASQVEFCFSPFPVATFNFKIIIFDKETFFASVFHAWDPNRSQDLGHFVLSRSFYKEFCQICLSVAQNH